MPRLSLWKPQKANDYRYFDRNISEMFTVGATDMYIHLYLGSNNPANSVDLTQPHYPTTDPTNIQDLLFLENRDRKYNPNIYRLRGHYNVQNLDFDLSQFGLFLTNDVIFITVHYNDMIDVLGRKLMVGDVFELPHLTDYHPLNKLIPIGLRRYYQITDANYASEGFSSTWYPHLWRVKCEPLVNSQEFSDILSQPINTDNYMGDWDPTKTYEPGYTVTYGDKIYTPIQTVPPGVNPPDPAYWQLSTEQNLIDILSTYNKNIEINQAVIDEAARIVPKMGYDRSQLYIVPTFENGEPSLPLNVIVPAGATIAATGTLMMISNPSYKYASAAIRISKASIKNEKKFALLKGTSALLEAAVIAPHRTDTNSGPVHGDNAIKLSSLGMAVNGPYGTADNTYSEADQYLRFTLTSLFTPENSTTIYTQGLSADIAAGLLVQAFSASPNGTIIQIFPDNTRITSYNSLTNTFTVNNATINGMPERTVIVLNSDFTGEVTAEMDYRADCDPRYQFIRRSTPRSFGYVAGYNMGNDQAPNGEALESGIVFPVNPRTGDYFLRIDYLPQKLFRFNGKAWLELSQNVRTATGFGLDDESELSTFINNYAVVPVSQGGTVPSRQSLSQALRIQPD